MTPRLIATDLDGTLLRSDGTVSDRTRRVLAQVEAAGIPVVLVTGRPIRWMVELFPLVGSHGLAVLSNGAVIYDVARAQPLEVCGIGRDAGLALAARIAAAVPSASFALECESGIRCERGFVDAHRVPEGSPVGPLHDLWDEPALKLLVRGLGVDDDAFRVQVVEAVGDRAVATWSGPVLVEISAAGVTKAAALARVCERLGVDAADVVAFGDMRNDVPMLEWAGTAYAVADADVTALAAADHLAPSNDDDGVARVLARLVPSVGDLF